MTLVFFVLACLSALHGFQVGGTSGFMYLMGSVLLLLFGLASAGMNAPRRISNRPSRHPPGW
jgi:hypothetical protein